MFVPVLKVIPMSIPVMAFLIWTESAGVFRGVSGRIVFARPWNLTMPTLMSAASFNSDSIDNVVEVTAWKLVELE